MLDLALAELIFLCLVQDEKELRSFLGLDSSANAPAGALGARIQLALLLGLITREDPRNLRSVKSLRMLYLTVFTVYQVYFHRLSGRVTRIADVVKGSK